MFSTLGGCEVSWSFLLCNERNDHSILNIAKVYLHLNKWKEATQCIANQKCVCVCDIRAKKSTSAQFCRNSRMLFKIVYIFNFFFFLNYQECFSKLVSCCIIVKTNLVYLLRYLLPLFLDAHLVRAV